MSLLKVVAVLLVALASLPAVEAPQFADWSAPENAGPVLNCSGKSDMQAFVSRDGLSLYYSSGRPGGRGLDIYVSQRASTAEPWSEPVPLEGVNTEFIENHPRLSFDRTELYLTSTRPQIPAVTGAQQELYVTTSVRLSGRK